ncbi:MAG: TIGR03086 family metal-binding protein [Nocardioides sp.]
MPSERLLDEAVELLDRALAYTRGTLAGVTDADLGQPTPCHRWDLGQLLAHMEDALDAFAEGAGGMVSVAAAVPAPVRVASLQRKACALLGAWAGQRPSSVRVDDQWVATEVVVAVAALEITVHGWDVGVATGRGNPLPEDLARRLLPVARGFVAADDRGTRFGDPLPPGARGSSADHDLLAFLGRDRTGPPGQIPGNPYTQGRAAS